MHFILSRLIFNLSRFIPVFLVVCAQSAGASSRSPLYMLPVKQPVYIGQKVVLTCQVKGLNSPLEYAVLFKRNEKGISEKCQAYDRSMYQLECDPNDWQKATTYKLLIHSVSWSDRGDWFCIYAANSAQRRLEVYAPAELKKMGVTTWQPPVVLTHQQRQQFPGEVASGKMVQPIAAVPGVGSVPGSPPASHIGLGTRTNPYDLRPGLGLQLTCETTCGYPEANISWLIVNETSSRPGTTTTGPHQIRSDTCNRAPSTAEMSTTRSALNVNCWQLGLVGLNEVQCAVSGRQYVDHTPTRHIYVLCPGGERPMQLTHGEVVAIAVGCAIALILAFMSCVVVRNSRKESPFPMNAHLLGQRV